MKSIKIPASSSLTSRPRSREKRSRASLSQAERRGAQATAAERAGWGSSIPADPQDESPREGSSLEIWSPYRVIPEDQSGS
ncbi:MAG: hypothetical protein WCK77_11835 [Verrucomicrobiota bacterium]